MYFICLHCVPPRVHVMPALRPDYPLQSAGFLQHQEENRGGQVLGVMHAGKRRLSNICGGSRFILFFCHRRYLRLARPLSLRRWERRRVVIQQLTPVTRLASWLACPVITRNCGDRAGDEPSPSLKFHNHGGFPYDGLLRDCKTSNFAKVLFHL